MLNALEKKHSYNYSGFQDKKPVKCESDKLNKLNELNKLNKLFTAYALRLTKDSDLGFDIHYFVNKILC